MRSEKLECVCSENVLCAGMHAGNPIRWRSEFHDDWTVAASFPRTGLKEMGEKWPRNSRLFAQSLHSCPTLRDPVDCSPTRLLRPWDSPGKKTAVGCHSLLQGIFPARESKLHLLHCRWVLSHQTIWEATLLNFLVSSLSLFLFETYLL